MITEGILRDRDEMDEKHTSTQTQQTAVCVLTAWITQLRDSLRQDDGIGGVPIESESSCMPKQRPPRPIHAILVYLMLDARHRRIHTNKCILSLTHQDGTDSSFPHGIHPELEFERQQQRPIPV